MSTATHTHRVPSPHQSSPEPRSGETLDSWTDRLCREGAAIGVFRQCSIGWHDECSTRGDGPNAECRCTCHLTAFTWEQEEVLDRFEEEPDAPESFDARQTLLRVVTLVDHFDDEADSQEEVARGWYEHGLVDVGKEHDGVARGLREAASALRAALAEPSTLLPIEEEE